MMVAEILDVEDEATADRNAPENIYLSGQLRR